ncbi:amidase [Pantanalinema sp. GBBB05]|uniref:amidase n=1 Tax=Pantanalinema sp. GBBB05 TaxID=2604139 RepID=UPI001DF41A2A|nr:amidase [Pantanalinema sp. GBBB05]
MNLLDLAFAPALEQARLIRRKEVSPLELTELYLDRIQQLDPKINSYFWVAADHAIAEAKAKTESLAGNSEELPLLFGVPISIKDLNPVAGMPCTFGVRLLKKQIATADDGVVRRIRQAGCIILGKTATSEMATLPYTEPDGFPPTRNPWQLDYTPGGSSGGAAAALAAGLCAISHGSDGGGSIRGPAFCCGLVGIKPSRGRVTHAPVGDRLNGIATNGPIGRTVADAAALLDVMAGYEVGDPYWLPDPDPSFLAATTQNPGRLKIGLATTIQPAGDADQVCQQAAIDTARLLETLGHEIEVVSLDFSNLVEPFRTVYQAILGDAGWAGITLLGKVNRWLSLRAQLCSSGKYLRAVTEMQKEARRIVGLFDSMDVLLSPTYMHPPIRIQEWAKLSPAKTLDKVIDWIAPCPPFNASGQPAIAIPTGLTPQGLPIGVQLVGRPAAESTLIALAAQLEAAQDWGHQRPPLVLAG